MEYLKSKIIDELGLPEGLYKALLLRCAEEEEEEDAEYYSKLKQIMKAYDVDRFLEKLIKAAGEGSKGGHVIGHTATGKPIYGDPRDVKGPGAEPAAAAPKPDASNRKPFPGVEAHALSPTAEKPTKTYIPPEGTIEHYSDTPNLKAYKKLLSAFKREGVVPHGHITFDLKTDKCTILSEQGRAVVDKVVSDINAKMQGQTQIAAPMQPPSNPPPKK